MGSDHVEVDPLTCPKCSGEIARSPTKATGPPKPIKYTFDYSNSKLPASDKCLDVDVEYPESYVEIGQVKR
jgi:hypothetical protein